MSKLTVITLPPMFKHTDYLWSMEQTSDDFQIQTQSYYEQIIAQYAEQVEQAVKTYFEKNIKHLIPLYQELQHAYHIRLNNVDGTRIQKSKQTREVTTQANQLQRVLYKDFLYPNINLDNQLGSIYSRGITSYLKILIDESILYNGMILSRTNALLHATQQIIDFNKSTIINDRFHQIIHTLQNDKKQPYVFAHGDAVKVKLASGQTYVSYMQSHGWKVANNYDHKIAIFRIER